MAGKLRIVSPTECPSIQNFTELVFSGACVYLQEITTYGYTTIYSFIYKNMNRYTVA